MKIVMVNYVFYVQSPNTRPRCSSLVNLLPLDMAAIAVAVVLAFIGKITFQYIDVIFWHAAK
jgi:hypothetical protein